MDLEEIKEWRKSAYLCFDTIPEISRIDWLIEEVDRLKSRNEAWNQKFHERCEAQLDCFRKGGMLDAAMRCAEIAEENTVYQTSSFDQIYADGETPADAIRKEFGL